MKTVLYVWQAGFPWDVRASKITRTLRDRGFRVAILARYRGEPSSREILSGQHAGIEVIRVGAGLPSFMSTPVSQNPIWQQAIRAAIEELKPTLVMPREILLAQACGQIAHKQGIPVIMDMAEHYPAAMKEWKKYNHNPIAKLLVGKLALPAKVEKWSLNCMDGVVTVCAENSLRLEREYGYPLIKTIVTHNTPELSVFENVKKGSQTPPVVFAHHGYLTKERNLETFIEGFALALKQFPHIRLLLAGEGESLPDIQATIARCGIETNVELTGGYKHEDLINLYSRTDIGIIPNIVDTFRNHTLPNKLFDYLACGKPALVSRLKPLERIIAETQAGVTVDCENAEAIAKGIAHIMTSSSLNQMSQNGLRWAKTKYNWAEDTDQLLGFISKVL